MREFTAELGVYRDCHIVDVLLVQATSRKDALAQAKSLEDEYSAREPGCDWWVDVEDLY